MNTKYRDDPESTFRDLRRRGLLRPIRTKGNQQQSRNMYNVSEVTPNGEVRENTKRDVLYTTRNHGDFDDQENAMILRMYNENIMRIKNWKTNKLKGHATTGSDLLQ